MSLETTDLKEATLEKAIKEGYSLTLKGEYKNAEKIFSDLLNDYPTNTRVIIGMATNLQHQGRATSAVKSAKIAMDIDPKCHEAHRLTAEAHLFDRKDFQKAEEEAKKVFDINVSNSTIESFLSQLYLMKKDYKAAYSRAKEALRIDKKNYVAHLCFALYHLALKEDEKAIPSLEKGLDGVVMHDSFYGNYKQLLTLISTYKTGYEHIKAAAKVNKADKTLLNTYKEAYIKRNPVYAPLKSLTNGFFDDVYLVYGAIGFTALMAILAGFDLEAIPDTVTAQFLDLSLWGLIVMIGLSLYRFITRQLVSVYYRYKA